jgi:serine/threonine protein kinase
MAKDAGVVLEVGDRVGSYRIVGALGPGAYRAVHVDSPRRAVVHVGPSEAWREAAVHVLRAARVIESLAHPGIAPIVERGVLDDRRSWWASEVPSGIGLYDVVARRALPSGELAALVRDVAEVLAHAHAKGFVHRALALRSIVLATGARAFPLCVTDWGVPAAEPGVFAAPEGASGDGRADVYALGVIAYRAATRRFPVDRKIDELPGVAPALATLIARMLAVDPAERPAAAEVRALAGEVGVADAGDARDARDTGDAGEDVVAAHVAGPRFARPRWTPAPPLAAVTSNGANNAVAAGEIVAKN